MIALLDLSFWVDQLTQDCPVFAGRVFKTLPADDLEIDQHESPVAFVYVADDNSEEDTSINGVRQKMTSIVNIEIQVRRTASATDKFSEADVDTLRDCRQQVFNSLFSWTPDDCEWPVQHQSGSLKKKDKKVIKFTDTFSTKNLLIK